MPRKSAKMIRKGHVVAHPASTRELRVTGVQTVEGVHGEMIEITLDNGDVWRRTPGAMINVIGRRK